MVRKLLCGSLATLLLANVSTAFAEDWLHASELIDFAGFRTIKLETKYRDDLGNESTYSRTACLDSAGFYLAKGSVNPGHLDVEWSIKTDDDTFELIHAYAVALHTIPGTTTAYSAYPSHWVIDMTSWENRRGPHGNYPSCEPVPFLVEMSGF